MSIIGDPITVCKKSGAGYIRAFMWGISNVSSYSVIGVGKSIVSFDPKYFTYDSSTRKFTVLIGGTYNIVYFGRGGYSSSGATRNLDWRIRRTRSGSTSNLKSGTGLTNTGTYVTSTVSLEAGDVVFAETKNSDSGSTNSHSFGFGLYLS